MSSHNSNPYLDEILALMIVSPTRFFETVISNVPKLITQGYEPESFEDPFFAWLWKEVDEGVHCAVRFELMLNYNPQGFKITVLRRRQRTSVNREKPYAPVIWDLRNVASLLFGKELFPIGRSTWDFNDEITLIQQLTSAEAAIVEYGLPWIEDPKSNVGKLRTLMRKKMQSKGAK